MVCYWSRVFLIHDLEWISGIISKANEDIKKSDGSQEVFDAGANCIESLEKTISSSKLEGYYGAR